MRDHRRLGPPRCSGGEGEQRAVVRRRAHAVGIPWFLVPILAFLQGGDEAESLAIEGQDEQVLGVTPGRQVFEGKFRRAFILSRKEQAPADDRHRGCYVAGEALDFRHAQAIVQGGNNAAAAQHPVLRADDLARIGRVDPYQYRGARSIAARFFNGRRDDPGAVKPLAEADGARG